MSRLGLAAGVAIWTKPQDTLILAAGFLSHFATAHFVSSRRSSSPPSSPASSSSPACSSSPRSISKRPTPSSDVYWALGTATTLGLALSLTDTCSLSLHCCLYASSCVAPCVTCRQPVALPGAASPRRSHSTFSTPTGPITRTRTVHSSFWRWHTSSSILVILFQSPGKGQERISILRVIAFACTAVLIVGVVRGILS